MALLMAKTNTNLILSWIALILCFPFGIPALVLAYSVRVSTVFYHYYFICKTNIQDLAVKIRDDNFNFENLKDILLKCKKRANWARGLSITGIVVSALAGARFTTYDKFLSKDLQTNIVF